MVANPHKKIRPARIAEAGRTIFIGAAMNQETAKKDYFWVYIAGLTFALVAVVAMAKLSENEKYDPIRQQQNEDIARMNIRVLN
jgi:bacteriorhodopsin